MGDMYDVVVEKFAFAISSPDEFLWFWAEPGRQKESMHY